MRQRCLQCWQIFSLSLFMKHCLSTSSLGCNALCIVISFLILWSIYLSLSLVHFRKGPEYLTKGTVQVFISLIRFRQQIFVTSSFLVLRYSFLNFVFHFHMFDGVSLQDAQVFVVFFSPCVLILSWSGSSIRSVRCICHFSWLAWHIFLC